MNEILFQKGIFISARQEQFFKYPSFTLTLKYTFDICGIESPLCTHPRAVSSNLIDAIIPTVNLVAWRKRCPRKCVILRRIFPQTGNTNGKHLGVLDQQFFLFRFSKKHELKMYKIKLQKHLDDQSFIASIIVKFVSIKLFL